MQFKPAHRPVAVGLAIAATLVLLTGCASRALDFAGACPELDTSQKVPTCTALFSGNVGLKLPAGPDDEPIGAVTRGGEYFIDGSGAKFRMEARKQSPASVDTAYATTVYQAKVSNRRATALKPVLRVTEEALLTHFFGSHVMTGVISARLPDGSYNLRPELAIVIKFDARARGGELQGIIANADRDVRAAGGTCARRLSGLKNNPLVGGFAKQVSISRVPSMHVPYSDELILAWSESSSGMGNAMYPSLVTAMGHDPLGTTWEVTQHGNPTSGPALRLRLAGRLVEAC